MKFMYKNKVLCAMCSKMNLDSSSVQQFYGLNKKCTLYLIPFKSIYPNLLFNLIKAFILTNRILKYVIAQKMYVIQITFNKP